jgi:hypothetical protein
VDGRSWHSVPCYLNVTESLYLRILALGDGMVGR